jgi:LCP family protein required for cell wall assembly
VTGYGTDHNVGGKRGVAAQDVRGQTGYPSGLYASAYQPNGNGAAYGTNGHGSGSQWATQDGDNAYGRALIAATVSVILPGIGHAMAGHKRTGRVLFSAVLLLIATAAIAYVGLGRARLAALTVDTTALTWIVYGALGLGVAWSLVVVSAFLVNRPAVMTVAQRLGATVLVGLLAVTVFATGAGAAYYANTQLDLVSSVFPNTRKGVHKPNFFAGKPRVNIMLLGSDAGEDRTGVRTDTVIVASINTKSGRTVMFSLPRNLLNVPFPEGSAAAQEFPNGFHGTPTANYMLNAVYKYGHDHPDLVPHSFDPGAALLQQGVEATLGVKVDYYMMIDLRGFAGIVNALGGIKVVVKKERGRPIPIGGEHNPDGSVKAYPHGSLPLGKQKLNGYQALWYARSRFYADDYFRMARQQCVLGAIARQATPINVLKGYQRLAKTAKDAIVTDIPSDALESMVTLAAKGKTAKITTVSFNNKVINTGNPDFEVIHQKVQAALEAAAGDARPKPSSTPSATSTAKATATPSSPHTTSSAAPGEAVSVDDVCEYW